MGSSDTEFGWDTSSHDDTPASVDGLTFFTTKITDGDHYYHNPTASIKLNRMYNLGMRILGGYHVSWGNRSVANQIAWFLQMLTADFPHWKDPDVIVICQSDNEPFYTGQTPFSINQQNSFHDGILNESGGKIVKKSNIAYSPTWVFGQALTGLRYPWWSSNYGSNLVGPYRDVYARIGGNQSKQWAGYIAALYLQFSSNCIIAGQTTSDGNAFPGNLADMLAALGHGIPVPPEEEDVTPTLYKLPSGAVWAVSGAWRWQIVPNADPNALAAITDLWKVAPIVVSTAQIDGRTDEEWLSITCGRDVASVGSGGGGGIVLPPNYAISIPAQSLTATPVTGNVG